jgi:radical SAM protein with 4Fe4S-binding SPASM domain
MDLRAVPRRLIPDYLVAGERWVRRGLVVRYLDPKRPSRFPDVVQIEATSMCNLRCPLCSHSREKSAGQHLSGDRLRAILDRLPRTPPEVRLSGIGEPLVNPSFFELVDILAERGIRCEFYTNGTLLGRQATRKAIFSRPNIRSIRISCDGASKETFEAMRLGAEFEAWKRSVQGFVAQAAERRGKALRTGVITVLSRQNLNEIGDVIRLVADLGMDRVHIQDPMPIDDEAASWCPTPDEIHKFHQHEGELRALGKSLGVFVSFRFRREESQRPIGIRCLQPWMYIFIRATGEVAPCCAVFGSDRGAVMGSLIDGDFEAVWRGNPYREFRTTCASGTNDLCLSCSYY